MRSKKKQGYLDNLLKTVSMVVSALVFLYIMVEVFEGLIYANSWG